MAHKYYTNNHTDIQLGVINMMTTQESVNILSTTVLFDALNVNRQKKGLTIIEDALIARKLNILFTFKTNERVDFKDEMVKLKDEQLIVLQEILEHYFNVAMTSDIHAFAIKQTPGQENRVDNTQANLPQPKKVSLLKKLTGFFKKKSKA